MAGQWRFERVFNLGTVFANIFSGLIVVGGLIGVYISLREIIVRQDERLVVVEREMNSRKPIIEEFIQNRSRLSAIEKVIEDNKMFTREAVKELASIRSDIAVMRALYEASQKIDNKNMRK